MFGSKKNTEANASSLANGKTLSLNTLVKGTEVEGNIKTESDIRIDGTLIGNLQCDSRVIIGPSGVVEGDINCQSAVIEGQFEGNLSAAANLTLKETAVINGEASYDKLVVHQGAVINATIRRNSADTSNTTTSNNTSKNSVKKTNVRQEVEA